VGDATRSVVESQLRRFLAREVDSRRLEAEGRIPPSLRATAGELGLFGLSIPEAHGGLGLDLLDCAHLVEEIARVDRSLATMIGLHNGLGARPLVERGDPALAAEWLPRLATGEVIAAFAATEAGAGSDLTRTATRATFEGDEVVLRGEKHFVTNGGIAGAFTALARTPGRGGERGQALVFVPRDLEGVEIGPEERKLGLNASSTVTVSFVDVRLPRSHVLGEEGAGAADALAALEWGRTLLAAGCVGTANAAVHKTLDHVAARRQFGRALLDLPAVQEQVAQMLRERFAMEALVRAVGRAHRAGEPFGHLAMAAKVVCSEGVCALADRAVQLHGGLGYLEDTGVARLLRDARVTRIFEGANDVLLVRAGTALYVTGERPARVAPGQGAHARRRAVAERELDAAVAVARARRGLGGVRDQRMLQALARADFALLTAAACAARHAADPTTSEQAVEDQLARAARWLRGVDDTGARGRRDAALIDHLVRTEMHA